jgi:hypothetical protein
VKEGRKVGRNVKEERRKRKKVGKKRKKKGRNVKEGRFYLGDLELTACLEHSGDLCDITDEIYMDEI